MKKHGELIKTLILLFVVTFATFSQKDYWQQHAEYIMDLSLDVKTHLFKGTQKLVYTNNSPETLTKVYYHLYFNAFQPGSMMDIRNLTIKDSDRRVGSRISKLKPNEIGRQDIKTLTQDGESVKFKTVGTILEVTLAKPIAPNSKTTLEMSFEGQVPKQIRRSGRDNKEGISYTMTQWYPKLTEFDENGWNANPYIGREFHGVWGNFDVKITLDSSYTVASTGVLQNADKIGHGYVDSSMKNLGTTPTNTWHFVGKNIHDFTWGADPDYVHTTRQVENGPLLHFFYQPGEKTTKNWEKLPEYTEKMLGLMEAKMGKYPYPQYSVVQGGDGGMEYAMLTMITGHRSFRSLVGVTVHELVHSWYQFILGTNEALYAWMDEGFTTYVSGGFMSELFPRKNKKETLVDPYSRTNNWYINFKKSGNEEVMSTHSDHYELNSAYSLGSYGKGAVYLNILNYIVGQKNFDKILLTYYDEWKFKHPTPTRFKMIAERVSGIELDWMHEYFIYTTHDIDYGIRGVSAIEKTDDKDEHTEITLEKIGRFPMPLDIKVTLKNGDEKMYYIPLVMMRGEKTNEFDMDFQQLKDWSWTHPYYKFTIDEERDDIQQIEIDPTRRMPDVNRLNNMLINEDLLRKGQSTRENSRAVVN